MRHFVATILIAFLIMVGQQMEYETHPKDAQPELCMFLGKFLLLTNYRIALKDKEVGYYHAVINTTQFHPNH